MNINEDIVNVDDDNKLEEDDELRMHIDRIRGYNSDAFKDLNLETGMNAIVNLAQLS